MQSTNYRKFQTRNPVVRGMIDRFYAQLQALVEPLKVSSLLDAGCGEGETLARLGALMPARTVAVDISSTAVEHTAKRLPSVEVSRQSILELPFDDKSFDLVLCLEVLEHLPDPSRGLAELGRVTREHLIVSVPHEPWFRAGSLLRGKYLRGLGNHPEHVNHWGRRSLREFLAPEFEAVSLTPSFPWLLAHCRRQDRP